MDADGDFRLIDATVRIPAASGEFAINAGNQRYWLAPVQRYIADCVAGADGPRGKNFGQRWVGSLVADAWLVHAEVIETDKGAFGSMRHYPREWGRCGAPHFSRPKQVVRICFW